jgi:N-methylhydantoinase B
MTDDPIQIEIFRHLFASIAEEMGVVLRRSSYSPNIKERLDYSCALFDDQGDLVAQAAHIPVHLGAMPHSVQACMAKLKFEPGDIAILNDPFQGGTHLPDITLVSPVWSVPDETDLLGFVASRAHHADVGGSAPGSMAIVREVFQEGIVIPPIKLQKNGKLDEAVLDLVLANVRTPEERRGDLTAQIAANEAGISRLQEMEQKYGTQQIRDAQAGLLDYSERLTATLLKILPSGVYRFSDQLDDDGITSDPVEIHTSIEIGDGRAMVDFSGSSMQRPGGINAVYPVTLAAAFYAFRCLMGPDVPTNSGSFRPIQVIAPPGTVVNARHPAPVAGGNVETSQRITDVLLGALSQAAPNLIPAASQGTMNNLTIGGWNPEAFAYYETIAGGCGAMPDSDGASGVHSHMTNTMNTPIEALEFTFPLRVRSYSIRRGSGGNGRFRGGDGIRREIELLTEAQITILSERRRFAPYGLNEGDPGETGRNQLISGGMIKQLPGKGTLHVKPGDVIRIDTPGGGGYGKPIQNDTRNKEASS